MIETVEDKRFIKDLIKEVKLDEPFDWEAKVYTFRRNGERVGLIGFNFQKTDKGLMPLFEHLLIKPKFQKTRVGVKLMILFERILKKMGYNQYLSCIKKTNDIMRKYALKWGMKSYKEDSNGVWYYKTIGG